MPTLERPDGVELHWEARGDGPGLVIVHQFLFSYPGVYAELIDDLSRDHRVAWYDPRGCGSSSRRGPYDVQTDADDLEAVVASAFDEAAVALAMGYGYNIAVRVGAGRPDLIAYVLAGGPAAAAILPRSELAGAEGLAASESVIEMVMKLMSADPRSGLRTLIAAVNPDLDEQSLRERVDAVADYMSAEAGLERGQAWLEDDASEFARLVGERLWILHTGDEPLFAGALAERVAELYPAAHLEQFEGGPISRPDLTAARIRELTSRG